MGILTGSAIAAWLAVVSGALACALEIGISPAFPYGISITIPIMLFWHIIIAVGEAIITSAVVSYTLAIRADLLELPKA
jgi:cobalt/nickel transport system permease protein